VEEQYWVKVKVLPYSRGFGLVVKFLCRLKWMIERFGETSNFTQPSDPLGVVYWMLLGENTPDMEENGIKLAQ
jgi:hypothetical protein